MKKKLFSTVVASLVAAQAGAGTVTSDGSDIVISTKGGFAVKTADGEKSFNLGGRIQWDYNRAEADSAGEPDEDDMGIRRARIFTQGQVGDWGYKAQFNIGESDSAAGTVEDLYIRYNGWGSQAKLTIGRQKEPFGLEQLTSSKDIAILERAATTELYAPGRNTGIQLHGKSGMFTYGVGLFEDGEASTGDPNRQADELAITGRITAAPIHEGNQLLHVGLGYTDRAGSDSNILGLELAGVLGPFHAQAEYFDAEFDTEDADGFYLQAGWILTGESRPYKDGVFKIVKPADKSGAWELVVRYEDGDGNYGDIEQGVTEGNMYAFGVNYYPNGNIRLGASYMSGEDDISGDEGDEIRLRLQYVYK